MPWVKPVNNLVFLLRNNKGFGKFLQSFRARRFLLKSFRPRFYAVFNQCGYREGDEGRIVSVVGATRLGAELTETGWTGLFLFLATINVFIGIFNLSLTPFRQRTCDCNLNA